jgi:hypothetical protein
VGLGAGRAESMTVTLTFRPEVEAGLLAQSQSAGMTLGKYLRSVMEAWSASHRVTPPLSDYAVSREALYEGRDH